MLHGSSGLLAATLGWTAMMAVMMAPTVAPWVAAFHRFGPAPSDALARTRSTTLFAIGYLAVWAGWALVIAVLQRRIEVPAGWSGAILIGAGLFQITPLKNACLTHCRSPFSFLLTHWKDGPLSAFQLGASHGAYCVGCCWALMITLLAVGFASVAWMAVLAAITLIEQVAPWGARLRVPIGVALALAGVSQYFFKLFSPS